MTWCELVERFSGGMMNAPHASEGEEDMTLADLKRRPCGKASAARSSLHDD
eukprot:COSAG06_NODE_28555_length_572_cov_0.911205_1_plen_50_part_10